MKKHLAIICGVMYPNASATGICARRFAEILSEDYDIDIICMASDSIATTAEDNGIRIHVLSGGTIKREAQSSGAIKRLHHLCGQIQIKTRFLANMQWFANAAFDKLLEIDKKKKIDVVFSVCSPLAAHCAALKFKKIKDTVRWVAYTVDLYATIERIRPIGYSISDMIKREMFILSQSDAVFLSEEIYRNHSEMVDKLRDVSKLPYVIPEQDFVIFKENKIFDKSEINCVYAGSFYHDMRNPKVMLDIFSRITDNRIKLHLYSTGYEEMVEKYAAQSDVIIIHGRVSQDVIKEVYREADILINIGNANADFIPSKTFEYIGTGKPIVNFYYGKEPDYAMARYPLALHISNEAEVSSIGEIEIFLNKNEYERLPSEKIMKLYPNNTIGYIKKLLESRIG